MKKSVFAYFKQGHHQAHSFVKKGFGNRLKATLHQTASMIASLVIFFIPPFAASNHSYAYMLHESGDAILEKSFDGAENGKIYFSTLAVYLVAGLMGLSAAGLAFGVYYPLSMAIDYSVANTSEAITYKVLIAVVVGLFGLVGLVVALLYCQAGVYLINKNKLMGTGDVLYNAARFLRKCGTKLFFINLLHLLQNVAIVAAFVAGYIVLYNVASKSYQFYRPMLFVFSFAVLGLFAVFYILFAGQLLTAWRVSTFSLLADEAEAIKYAVVYPEVDNTDAVTTKGRFIEIVALDDDEVHPLENNSVEDEDPWSKNMVTVIVLAVAFLVLAVVIPIIATLIANATVLRPHYPSRPMTLKENEEESSYAPGMAKAKLELLRGPNNAIPAAKARRNLVIEFEPDVTSIDFVVFLTSRKRKHASQVADSVTVSIPDTEGVYNLPLPAWVAGVSVIVTSINQSTLQILYPYHLSRGQKAAALSLIPVSFGLAALLAYVSSVFFFYGVRGGTMSDFNVGIVLSQNLLIVLPFVFASAVFAFVTVLLIIRRKKAKKGAIHG